MESVTPTSKSDDHLFAFPNIFPYNEMLFDGKLRLANFRVKTRGYDPGFRGPVLLYTSGRIERCVAQAHGYNPKEYIRPAIVGVGDLKKVRELSEEEFESMFFQFNNATSEDEVYSQDGCVEPLSYGLFFQRLRKFKEPIAFTAAPGPVKRIKVPLDIVGEALEDNGIGLVENKLIYL